MARARKNAVRRLIELTRPELAWTLRSRRGEETTVEQERARDPNRAENVPPDTAASGRREGAPQERWRLVDITAMIIAVLQIILPITLVILAAVAGTYWLFMLAFGG